MFFLLSFFITLSTKADSLNIAVSSNFSHLIKQIIKEYKKIYDINVNLSIGSTANIYHQIINGAPYDIFLSADQKHPDLLKIKKLGVGEGYTYACGKLVIWSKQASEDSLGLMTRTDYENSVISIANPKTAPYGQAAKEYLNKINIYNFIEKKLVKGVNVAQVFNFAKSNNVDVAFVALSQIKHNNISKKNYYIIPKQLYNPIKQDVIVLKNGKNLYHSKQFYNFLKKDNIRGIINSSGYDIYC